MTSTDVGTAAAATLDSTAAKALWVEEHLADVVNALWRLLSHDLDRVLRGAYIGVLYKNNHIDVLYNSSHIDVLFDNDNIDVLYKEKHIDVLYSSHIDGLDHKNHIDQVVGMPA